VTGPAGDAEEGGAWTRSVLEVEGLDVPFGDAPGLRDVAFTVGAGERFVLVGASGSGKTSLLRAIAGTGPLASRPPGKAGQGLFQCLVGDQRIQSGRGLFDLSRQRLKCGLPGNRGRL